MLTQIPVPEQTNEGRGMQVRTPFRATMGCFFSLLVLLTAVGSSAAPVPVGVGVVLDLTSDVGRKSLTCISMALDDFYLKHPSYATRARLSVRDSRGDLFTAAQATEELMHKNGEVQAIILSHTSPDAGLFDGMAERSNIPILWSSSATSPALQSRFFLRTAPNISSQAAPIASIIEAFEWRGAVLLHEDSPYGEGILSALVHAFRGSPGLTDSVAVPSDATDSRLEAELVAVKTMATRVYIVHMLPALAARLFHRAMVAGMMSEGYVWIATAGSLPNHGDTDNMQGVVSLLPHVQVTDQLRDFSRRFKVRFRQENPNLENDDPNLPASLIWLHDTAWAAAAAAEVSFRTAPSTTLLDALLVTKLDGLTGRFRLVDGQCQVSAYEIVNIFGQGARTVGFWTPELGISTSLYPKSAGKELKQVLWPGETAAVPIGWSPSSRGRPLRVAVPFRTGLREFQAIYFNPRNVSSTVSGYCIDVFEAAMKELDYQVWHRYVTLNVSYEALANMVHDKEVDAVAGVLTINASRMERVSFTTPFTDMGLAMIVADEDSSTNMWIFVKPLTPELWLTSLAFFLFTGLVVWEIEHRVNPRFRGTPWKQFGILFYFAFSTMVFSHKEKLESNLSKLVVTTWVFVVLILTTSYTASLTSMLTVRQLQPAINNWTNRDYVGFQDGSFVESILKDMGFDDRNMRRYSTIDEYADALDRGSANGGVRAIFDELPYLKFFLSRYCEGYSMVDRVFSGGFGFVFPTGSPMAADMSQAIRRLLEGDELEQIEDKWFGNSVTCVRRSKHVDARLTLRRFGGLFLTYAVVSCLVLVIHLVSFVSRKRRRTLPMADAETMAGLLPWLRAWLPRFDAFTGRREELGNNGNGAVELHHRMAAGATQQQGDTGGSHSTPMNASDSQDFNGTRNSAYAPVHERAASV